MFRLLTIGTIITFGLILSDQAFAQKGEGAWVKLLEKDNVLVETQKQKSGTTYIRGIKTFSFPVKRVKDTLLKVSSFTDWLPDTAVWQVLEQNDKEVFIYARHNLSWPLSDRDYRVRYTWKDLPGGGFQVTAKSTKAKGPKPLEGVIRLTTVHSVWTVTSLGQNRCRIEYRYEGSLGGDLPDFLIRSAWEREPVSILSGLANWLKSTS